ncbi:MAG: zinc-ribbon domain-containing protein [Desulfatiglandaceae bacterium]|jgi:predicted Zn finger-like uncharacterized protein
MIIFCEECGKRYRVNAEKIKGEKAKVRCTACAHEFYVLKSGSGSRESSAPSQEFMDSGISDEETQEKTGMAGLDLPETSPPRKRRFGLRAKMTILFFLIPIALVVAAGLLYIRQLDQLSSLITGESTRVVASLGEGIIKDKAQSVASQVELYLLAHPNLKRKGIEKDAKLDSLAVQKVGITGYTALYELPGEDGIWRTWAHVNPKIIGIDMSKLRKPLGKNFAGFWKVFTGVKDGKESKGYYSWQDKDGKVRAKFMVCTPVKGTPYVVAATTYLDEFTRNVKALEKHAQAMTLNTRNGVFGILGGTLLLIALIVFLYGHALTKKIRAITGLAERISLGELDAELDIKAKDEIGDLADAIGRMQESIRLSMERMQRRR